MAAVFVEHLEPRRLGNVAEIRVAERSVHGARQPGLQRGPPVALAEQGVQAKGADLGGRCDGGDALERRGQEQLRVGAAGDTDVVGRVHGAQVWQTGAACAARHPESVSTLGVWPGCLLPPADVGQPEKREHPGGPGGVLRVLWSARSTAEEIYAA